MLYQETVEAGLLDLIKRLMVDEELKDFDQCLFGELEIVADHYFRISSNTGYYKSSIFVRSGLPKFQNNQYPLVCDT